MLAKSTDKKEMENRQSSVFTADEARALSLKSMFGYIKAAALDGKYHVAIGFRLSDEQIKALRIGDFEVTIHETMTNGIKGEYSLIEW